MATRPKLKLNDDPLASGPPRQTAPDVAEEPKPADVTPAAAEPNPMAEAAKASKPRRTSKAKAKPAPPADGVGESAGTIEIYTRIPEPVALRLDEGQFAVRRATKAPRQTLVRGLLERHIGTSKAQLDAIVADVDTYRADLDIAVLPKRGLFVKLPIDLADRFDEVVFALRRREDAPTRQDIMAALIWAYLPEPNAAVALLDAA